MNIGILTFYRVANFGANLQAVSTYYYLKKRGHNPIFVRFESKYSEKGLKEEKDIQVEEHLRFIDSCIPNQTKLCYNASDVNKAICDYNLEAIIIGSDAVLQHHPLITRIHKGKRKPFYIGKVAPERMFPNVFWSDGLNANIPIAMMSVSSQNSGYKWFTKNLRHRMAESLRKVRYISVRDEWTKNMLSSLMPEKEKVPVTPDPVFAFNHNAASIIPTEKDIRNRFNLPEKYALVSLHSQSLKLQQLQELKQELASLSMDCVAFPMPQGINFSHPFDYTIDIPLNPLDWYALIKYSSAYIGSNMHPIVVSLHNAVPCFSIDNWGGTDFWGHKKRDGSSKVEHIMNVFGVGGNHAMIEQGKCMVSAEEIKNSIKAFPKEAVAVKADAYLQEYLQMMDDIIAALKTE